MLVASANDACEAVAWHIGGDDKRFVAMMNERAGKLGLKNTHFANPCGFDAPGHYSTAADLAKLTEQALQQPFFSMMVRTLVRDISTVDGTRRMSLRSTNELLVDPDVNGVKTGYTSKAGRCLIASMFKDGQRLLLVALNHDGSMGTGLTSVALWARGSSRSGRLTHVRHEAHRDPTPRCSDGWCPCWITRQTLDREALHVQSHERDPAAAG